MPATQCVCGGGGTCMHACVCGQGCALWLQACCSLCIWGILLPYWGIPLCDSHLPSYPSTAPPAPDLPIRQQPIPEDCKIVVTTCLEAEPWSGFPLKI